MINNDVYLKTKETTIKAYKKAGWKEITEDIKDGEMFLLLLEKADHPLQDSLFPITIGFNNYNEDGKDQWHLSGWCWSHAHFTEDTKGVPLLYKEFEHNIVPIIDIIE